MRNTNRMIALALCCALTLGAFAYRPPQAEAVAGVDDAIVIGALLTAFAGGCGLIFSNNGMTSGQIADGMAAKWDEFNQSAYGGAQTFAGWLGYDSIDDLWSDIKLVGKSSFVIPAIVARKFAEFAIWLKNSLVDDTPFLSGYTATLADGSFIDLGYTTGTSVNIPASSRLTYGERWDFMPADGYQSGSYIEFTGNYDGLSDGVHKNVHIHCYNFNSYTWDDFYVSASKGEFCLARTSSGRVAFMHKMQLRENELPYWASDYPSGDYSRAFSVTSADLSAQQKDGASIPDVAEDSAVGVSGVGWDATTIEELLQQILEQVQANTLAPTVTVDTTQTGGNTGTETGEDAKPYLPYIPQIFEKIKDIPGALSNIWETIKGIPAAVAEKIGAFFTTLWGWLSDIITEIKALPAAIVERIKALFVPHEGYAAEFVADITSTYQGRMGLLTYPFTVLADFVGTVAALEEQEPVLRWDAVKWHDKTLIAAGEYNLKSAVSSAQMQTIYTIYQTVISGVLVVAFLHLCYKKLKEVQRN